MDTRRVTQFLKGIAILMIVLCHSHQTFTLPGELNDILSFLQTGVQLFTILSSYGLCFSYNKASVNWFGFMKQRFSKIAILYWFAIALGAMYRFVYAIVMRYNILQEVNPMGIFVNALFLHGFSPDEVINNHIVRSGWYIGAIVILYAVFPFMFHLYFGKEKKWQTSRMYVFPLTIFAVTTILRLALKRYELFYPIEKFLSLLASFSLGFPLFELQTSDRISMVKFPFCKGIVFVVLSWVLFFSKSAISCTYVFSIGVAFFFLFVSILKKHTLLRAINDNNIGIVKFFSTMGKYSYHIYLTHSYIAFDFCYVFTAVVSQIYSNDLLWFIVLQPIVIFLSLFVGKYFGVFVSQIMKFLKF